MTFLKKINWKAVGRFLKRWGPPVAEAVIAKKAADRREKEDVR